MDPLLDLIEREGGYVNHPADRGGPTKYGITLAQLRHWREDNSLGAEDVQEIEKAEARCIYFREYVERAGFVGIAPSTLKWHLVDCGVMSGTRRAARWLQQAINDVMGADLKVDGLIGPITRKALAPAIEHERWRDVSNQMMAIRLRFLSRLAQSDANAVRSGSKPAAQSRALFIAGWTDRSLKFMT